MLKGWTDQERIVRVQKGRGGPGEPPGGARHFPGGGPGPIRGQPVNPGGARGGARGGLFFFRDPVCLIGALPKQQKTIVFYCLFVTVGF